MSRVHLGLLFSIVPLQQDDLVRRLVQVAGESLPLADEHGDLALQVLLSVVDHVNLQKVVRELRLRKYSRVKVFSGGATILVSYSGYVNLHPTDISSIRPAGATAFSEENLLLSGSATYRV